MMILRQSQVIGLFGYAFLGASLNVLAHEKDALDELIRSNSTPPMWSASGQPIPPVWFPAPPEMPIPDELALPALPSSALDATGTLNGWNTEGIWAEKQVDTIDYLCGEVDPNAEENSLPNMYRSIAGSDAVAQREMAMSFYNTADAQTQTSAQVQAQAYIYFDEVNSLLQMECLSLEDSALHCQMALRDLTQPSEYVMTVAMDQVPLDVTALNQLRLNLTASEDGTQAVLDFYINDAWIGTTQTDWDARLWDSGGTFHVTGGYVNTDGLATGGICVAEAYYQ